MNPHSNTEAIRVAHRGRASPAGARGGCWPLLTANRAWLRAHHIRATIPVKADQAVHRRTRGSRGGRPPTFDAVTHKNRNTVERGFSHLKHHQALATRYDKLAVRYQRNHPRHQHQPLAQTTYITGPKAPRSRR